MWGFEKLTLETTSSDGHNVLLDEDLPYNTKKDERIVVPKGADSDGASVPKFLWNLFPPFGSYWRAALLHDWLYRHTKRPKAECDLLLLEAMESCNVGRMKRETIYLAVKWFGGQAFKECRRRQDETVQEG
jgi:hypothetical protein